MSSIPTHTHTHTHTPPHLLYPSSVNGHLGCFHVLAIVNSAVVNIGMYVSFRIMFFSRYMPRSGIAGSYGSSICSFLRNLHAFSIVAIPVYLPTNSVGGFPSLHTLSTIYCLWIFLMIVILVDVKWYLIIVLTCISLVVSNVEHLFMCLLAICMSSLRKCLFRSSAHFLIGLFVLMLLSIMSRF